MKDRINENRVFLETLTMRNFKSYGNNVTTINFDKTGTILITGVDLDKTAEGTVANGTGKTTILDAISFAIYDKPIVDSIRTKDCLINNINKNNMEVTLTFRKRGEHFKIVRHRKMKGKGAGGVEFYTKENDEWVNISQTSKGTNEAIIDVIGLPHELFKQIVLFSATNSSFLSLPKTHTSQPSQKSMVEFLFGFDSLTKKAEELKLMRTNVRNDLKLEENEVSFKERERDSVIRMANTIKQHHSNWEESQARRVESIRKEIADLEKVDIEKELEILSTIQELIDISNSLDINNLRQKERNLRNDVNKLTKELESLMGGKCPYCSQDYHSDEEHKNTLVEELEAKSSELEVVTKEYDSAIKEEEEISIAVRTLRAESTSIPENRLIRMSSEIESLNKTLEEYLGEENPFTEQLSEIDTENIGEIDYSKLESLKTTLDHYEILIKLLSNNDSFIRKSILERSLPFLNKQLNEYLMDMGLEFNVYFTDNLDAKVIRFGREMEHGNVSNGQKARINIALSFAFRDVLQQLLVPFNVCFLDEVMDFGLDPVGVRNAARLIKRKAKMDNMTYYIITHRDEAVNLFDEVMTIEMKDGFSNLN